MQVADDGDIAHDGAAGRDVHPWPVGEQARGAAQLDGLAVDAQRGAGQGVRQQRLARAVGAHLGAPERHLAGHLGLDLVAHRRRGQQLGLREQALQHLGAEVEVGVGIADEDGLQRLAAVQHLGGDAQRVGAGEAAVDHDGLGLAGHEHGVDVEATGIGVDDLHGQRAGGGLGGGRGHHAQREGGGEQAVQQAGQKAVHAGLQRG
mmetsp:Transcript_45399/g.126294  ORF Transcript_45399/g.126294 Transcript_45399/m.126294 type:complete len:205 (+) Transcript_45399:538-1152(+)